VRKLVLLPFLLSMVLPPLGAGAQEPAGDESIDVRMVSLEVFVTDKSGKRAAGLERADFQVQEDGRPVEVTRFFAVASETAVSAEQRLHLAVVIDDLSLGAQSRNRLLKSLREEVVPRLRPQDLALVATSAGSAVEVVQGLTADKGLLLAALDRVEGSAPRGDERATEGRRLLQELDQAHLPEGSATDLSEITAKSIYEGIRRYSQHRYEESRGTLAGLTDFVDMLAGLPGRKALLYVSGGLSLRPGESLFRAWERKLGALGGKVGASSLDAFRQDLTSAFNATVEHANGNRVTVYSLGATETAAGNSAAGGRSSWTPDLESLEQTSLGDPLLRLADGTGGLAAVNAGDPRPVLARMSDDFQSYYSLGFATRGVRDGKVRKIDVSVRGGRDAVVRSRSAYREPPDRERMADHTLAALLLDAGENPLGVALEFTHEAKKGDGKLEVEMLVKFPLAQLVLLPRGELHEGKVSIWVSASDLHGRPSPVREVTVPIRVPNDQVLTVLGQNAAYKMPLLLGAGEHRIAVAVRDELGNVDSTVSVPFKPSS
jgi:VWFA-related protein